MPRPSRPSPNPPPSRELLRSLAEAWALAAPDSLEGGIALLDPFAGSDYPHGRPLLAGVASRQGGSRVVLAEEDPAKVEWLAGALAGAELHEGAPEGLEPLCDAVESAAAALLLVDPPDAGKLPLPLVQRWLAAPGAHLALRFPAAELRRLARSRGVAVADLPLHLKRTVEGVSRFLGDPRHAWLHEWTRRLEEGSEAAVGAISALYAGRLRRLEGMMVREVAVPGGELVDRFLLATRCAETSLLLNRVVHEMRGRGLLPWPEEGGVVRYRVPAELGLFPVEAGAPAPRERVVDRPLLAFSLARDLGGRVVTVEEVLRSQGETDLFADEVRRALRELRRDGKARFRGLGSNDPVELSALGARGMHRERARRRRAPRGELTLALEGD